MWVEGNLKTAHVLEDDSTAAHVQSHISGEGYSLTGALKLHYEIFGPED